MSGQANSPRTARPGQAPSAPLMPPARAARLLDEVIFARVAELIDLPRLYDLEAMLALQLDNLGVDSDEARAGAKQMPNAEPVRRSREAEDLARQMIDAALLRVARTSRKWTRWAPANPDDACGICGSSCEPQDQSTNA
jgi:hypothetical protein